MRCPVGNVARPIRWEVVTQRGEMPPSIMEGRFPERRVGEAERGICGGTATLVGVASIWLLRVLLEKNYTL